MCCVGLNVVANVSVFLVNAGCYIVLYFFNQANGLDERFSQTLQKMLVKYVASKQELWEDYLDMCVFAYNTSKHA